MLMIYNDLPEPLQLSLINKAIFFFNILLFNILCNLIKPIKLNIDKAFNVMYLSYIYVQLNINLFFYGMFYSRDIISSSIISGFVLYILHICILNKNINYVFSKALSFYIVLIPYHINDLYNNTYTNIFINPSSYIFLTFILLFIGILYDSLEKHKANKTFLFILSEMCWLTNILVMFTKLLNSL